MFQHKQLRKASLQLQTIQAPSILRREMFKLHQIRNMIQSLQNNRTPGELRASDLLRPEHTTDSIGSSG